MSLRIIGGGPSGLAAAITLARAGRDVEVFERRARCGARFGGDIQGIESWSDDRDAIDELASAGIPIDFHCAPVSSGIETNGRRDKRLAFGRRPGVYLVKRGAGHDTLDQGLARTALAVGVRIHFRQTIPVEHADIVATGPRGRAPFAVNAGIAFDTDAPDTAVVMFDDSAAPKGYSYLLVTKGYGCICTMGFEDFPSIHTRLARARDVLASRYGIRIENERRVGGLGHFALAPSYSTAGVIQVGEAAGLQDFLWGFGIRTAIQSGILAANCLLDGTDWEQAAHARFDNRQHAGVVNRFLWESLRIGRYRAVMLALSLGGPAALLRWLSRYNPVQRALFPIAKMHARKWYGQLEF